MSIGSEHKILLELMLTTSNELFEDETGVRRQCC